MKKKVMTVLLVLFFVLFLIGDVIVYYNAYGKPFGPGMIFYSPWWVVTGICTSMLGLFVTLYLSRDWMR